MASWHTHQVTPWPTFTESVWKERNLKQSLGLHISNSSLARWRKKACFAPEMAFQEVKHRQQRRNPAFVVLSRPWSLLRTCIHALKSQNHSELTKPPLQMHEKRKFSEADENCSSLNGRDLSPFPFFFSKERARLESSTKGPAHDKTKRLNDLWMWLSFFFFLFLH